MIGVNRNLVFSAGLKIPLRDALNMDTPLQPAEAAHPVSAVDMSSIPSKNGTRGEHVGPAAALPEESLPAGTGPGARVGATPAALDQYLFESSGADFQKA